MKKITTIALGTLVAGGVLLNYPLASNSEMINEVNQNILDEEQIEASNYFKVSGVISEINQDGERQTIVVEGVDDQLETHFPISNDVRIYNNGTTEVFSKDKLEKGLQVEVYYDKRMPIPMIYPAVIPPELIIVHDKENMGNVKVAKFDENLLSLDHELQLHVTEETVVMNKKGEEIKEEDLYGKELIVFYTISTKSLPAKTTPSKIIAVGVTNYQMLEIEHVINNDHYMKNDTKMMPLRQVAEFLGYDVEWHQEMKSVTVSNNYVSLSIAIGQKEITNNDDVEHFNEVPELINSKTYVPDTFLELLLW